MKRTALITATMLGMLLLTGAWGWCDPALNGIFGSNMVLQRDAPVNIWGTAAPAEQVTVTIGDQARTAAAGEDGRWRVTFEPLQIAGTFPVTVAGNHEIVLENVVLGDVWVCSGQSNMEMGVRGSRNAREEVAAADFPLIRLFNLPRQASPEPRDTVGGQWVPCSPTTVGSFSAAGYFFGRHLHRELGVPIGLINTSWGGTPAQAWTSSEALEAHADVFEPMFSTWERLIAAYPEAIEKYTKVTLPEWEKKVQEAQATGQQPP